MELKVLYWQTVHCYPQLKYGTQLDNIGTENPYSWTMNIKEMMYMGIWNKELHMLFCYKSVNQALTLEVGVPWHC
jgi:hypothetical protein